MEGTRVRVHSIIKNNLGIIENVKFFSNKIVV